MTPNDSYRCWTVTCDKCEAVIYLDMIGPEEGVVTTPIVPRCRSFELLCPKCRTKHEYSSADLKDQVLVNPPVGIHAHAFLDALMADDSQDS